MKYFLDEKKFWDELGSISSRPPWMCSLNNFHFFIITPRKDLKLGKMVMSLLK
jgi:hypothetical protein